MGGVCILFRKNIDEFNNIKQFAGSQIENVLQCSILCCSILGMLYPQKKNPHQKCTSSHIEYTHNTLTPLCQLILTYEHKISGSYHRRFVLFLLASTLSTLMCNHINTIEKTEKINEGQETRRISQILGRHGSNLEYFFNPIIFCVMFKVPVMLGVASGILLKSIKEHLFEQLKDSMEE